MRSVALVGALLSVSPGSVLSAQVVDYRRAEQMLDWNASLMISGDAVDPQWLPDGNRFWYRNKLAEGAEFVLVDPVANVRRPVFDNGRLAAAMSLARDTSYDPIKLPFQTFKFVDGERTIEFKASKKLFRCQLAPYSCTVRDTLPDERPFVVSPDSVWDAFVHQYNVWIRPRNGGDSMQLTTDGTEEWYYGSGPPRPYQTMRNDTIQRPSLRWSPDSKKIAVTRQDTRGVGHMHYISYTSQRPRHFSQPYALPGDTTVPLPSVHILTLPANLAVSLHPELDYVALDIAGEALIVADGLKEAFLKATGTEGTVLATFKAGILERKRCRHPFYERDSIILLGEHVTLEVREGRP